MIKELMIKSMDKIMLSCEEATYLISKSEVEKLGCVKNMQLKMHLAGCSFCRLFKLQSELIDQSLQHLEHMDSDRAIKHHLPQKKKEEIQKILGENV